MVQEMMRRSLWLVIVLLTGHDTFGDICSSITDDDIAPCGGKDISQDSCLSMGCCWKETKRNATQNSFTCFRSKRRNGTCIKYPEDGICFNFLNISVPQYRNTPRFIDYNIGLNRTNEMLKVFQNLINVVVANEITDTCLRTIRVLLCQYILTPCLEDGSIIQICRDDCDMFEEECPKTLQKLIGGAKFSLSESKSDFVHVSLPDCANLGYKEELAKEGKKCYSTGMFNDTKSKDDSKDSKASIIVPVVAVVSLLIVGALLGFLCYRRRMKRLEKRADLDPATPSIAIRSLSNFPSLSVKDHINMMTADDILKSKFSVNDPKKIKQYPVDMIAYEKDLGEGQFGQVFQGRAVGVKDDDPNAEVIVAVKTLKKGSSPEAKADFDQEACLMNFLRHPNIVRLLAVSAMEEPYCMIFEFMSNGDLSEYLRKSHPLIEDEINTDDKGKNYLSQATLIQMCVDVAKGLEYLACHRLIHRDVAARNCLVADDLTIKIADFGMSRDIYSNNYYKIERETVLPIRWLSPEAVMFGKFTVQSDIYSFGVLLWEVFTFSKQPYYGYTNKEVLEFISKGIHLGKPDFCPDFVYSMMKKCWAQAPELRPHYDVIMAGLTGKQPIYDTPTSNAESIDEQPQYQNFIPLKEKTRDAFSSECSETPNDPLIEKDTADDVFHASNPMYQQRDKDESCSDSRGSVNSAMDSDSDEEKDVHIALAEKQSSEKLDDKCRDKTYV